MEQGKIEAARRVLSETLVPDDYERRLDPAMRPEARRLVLDWNDAFVRGDVEWLLDHTDPEVRVAQPPDLPGAKRYAGHEGLIEAILDWPTQWDDFRWEWKQTYERAEGQIVSVTHHRGRGRETAIEVEADVVWVSTWRDGLLVRWEMFMGPDAEAQAAAAADQSRAASSGGAP
jgi:ketosteroid isomerase-like protein